MTFALLHAQRHAFAVDEQLDILDAAFENWFGKDNVRSSVAHQVPVIYRSACLGALWLDVGTRYM